MLSCNIKIIIRLSSSQRNLLFFATRRVVHSSTVRYYPIENSTTILNQLSVKPFVIQKLGITIGNSYNLSSNKDQEQAKVVRRTRRNYRMSDFIDDNGDLFEPEIAHGESVVDRKSVFQGHCAHVHRVEHVEMFLSKLKENKKIENAFHNMWAYRIDKRDPEARVAGKSATIVQDCDDDGEQAAGGRLLTLLQILNVVNVMVVVTRWYGGIQLGPARFKHINNAARDALVKGGFVDDGHQQVEGNSGSTAQSKGKKSGKNKKR